MPIYVDDEPLYFITVQSDQEGALRFEMNGEELMVKGEGLMVNGESVRYQPDSHHGSLKAPVVLSTLNSQLSTFKILEDNHVVIIRGGEKYSLTGTKLQ